MLVSRYDGKGMGVLVECEQCRAKRRAKHRNFRLGIMFRFIGISGLVEAKAVPEDHLLGENVIKLYAVGS